MHGCPWSVTLTRKFKNIDLLKNRNKKNIVCVDKSLLPYLNHISNFVPILPFRPSDYRSTRKDRPETEGRGPNFHLKKNTDIDSKVFSLFIFNLIKLLCIVIFQFFEFILNFSIFL